MKILHVSAECYPAAKAGGLGDVVGALPKYLQHSGWPSAAVIPKYALPWFQGRTFNLVYSGAFRLQDKYYPYAIEQEAGDTLGFPLYVVNLPGKFDRPGIYGDSQSGWYTDNGERWIFFQQAVLDWVMNLPQKPSLIHCHDHHAGLIPFMLRACWEFAPISQIPTAFTIHNGEYHGAVSWDKHTLLPYFDSNVTGLLDWNNTINPLASAIKCAWAVTTVSETYLQELMAYSNGLEGLLRSEAGKCYGILNGIDAEVWDPATDKYLPHHHQGDTSAFKTANKQALRERFKADLDLPTVTFIGRLVREKGADLLPELIGRILDSGLGMTFLILGTGEPHIHDALAAVQWRHQGRFSLVLEYNEGLAHQLYAGSDFLLMPSRVEPCGLNQMYSMRYGTIPVVRTVGGLKDTVPDIGEPGGRGIRFDHFSVDDADWALRRAHQMFYEPGMMEQVRSTAMLADFSWEGAAQQYIKLYQNLGVA
jgi:starch synthase